MLVEAEESCHQSLQKQCVPFAVNKPVLIEMLKASIPGSNDCRIFGIYLYTLLSIGFVTNTQHPTAKHWQAHVPFQNSENVV